MFALLRIICALMLLAAPVAALAQTNDAPAGPAKTVKAKHKKKVVHRAPSTSVRPNPTADQMTPGTGPGILRGGRDEGM